MATFFQKLRTVTLGAAHDLLDKGIDMNSPSALRQYVRDLEQALEKLDSEAAGQDGQVRTLNREIGDLEHNVENTKVTITALLAKNTPESLALAKSKGAQVVNWTNQIADKKTQLITQKQTAQQLSQTVSKLHAKHQTMLDRVRQLERLDQDSKAKEASAAALNNAGKMINAGADISVDDIESKMRQRNDAANAKFDRSMGAVSTTEDDADTSAVDDLLASLAPTKTASAKS